jgi:ribosomal protein S27AE
MKKSPNVKIVEVTLTRRIPLTEKVCSQCGTSFMAMKIQQYCSKACARKASYWRNPEAYRKSRLKSYRKQKGHAVPSVQKERAQAEDS